ncbi:MAG: hypothetical protein R3337_09795, partial [Gammaproteobacteria bacterium]|nr:hypothetical protein [Gammaproteobacteria bacterium]
MSRWPNSPRLLLAGLASVVLAAAAGCSGTLDDELDRVLPSKEVKYQSSRTAKPLEIPPDLSSATVGDSYPVPESSADGG